MDSADGWRKVLTVLPGHWKWMGAIAVALLMGGGGTTATVLGDTERGLGESALLVTGIAAMVVGGAMAIGVLIAWIDAVRKDRRRPTLHLPDPPPDPTFHCEAQVLEDGRAKIILRSSHSGSPLEDLIVERRPRAFEVSCSVEVPDNRGTSVTPTRTGCFVGKPVIWIYPDDFDGLFTLCAPDFPLVPGLYGVKCEWDNPRGARRPGKEKLAARCVFTIPRTIPVTTPAGRRTALAMKVLGLAIDVQAWFFSFSTAAREADGDTPGERKLRADRDDRVHKELPAFLERQREIWPAIEALGILAPDDYWEPTTLHEVEAWDRRLRGLVRALLRRE